MTKTDLINKILIKKMQECSKQSACEGGGQPGSHCTSKCKHCSTGCSHCGTG